MLQLLQQQFDHWSQTVEFLHSVQEVELWTVPEHHFFYAQTVELLHFHCVHHYVELEALLGSVGPPWLVHPELNLFDLV